MGKKPTLKKVLFRFFFTPVLLCLYMMTEKSFIMYVLGTMYFIALLSALVVTLQILVTKKINVPASFVPNEPIDRSLNFLFISMNALFIYLLDFEVMALLIVVPFILMMQFITYAFNFKHRRSLEDAKAYDISLTQGPPHA